jgi:chemotaxis regulatin CheY-phosphate phosphatase CheZ
MTNPAANPQNADREIANRMTSHPDASPPRSKESAFASAIVDLRRELEGMAQAVGQTRREIASMKPSLHGENCVTDATAEIAMAINSTEQAATDIMNVAERLQSISTELRAKSDALSICDEIESHAINLMLACSFQDLTGQRMTKASNTLRHIEQRVNGLIQIWGVTGQDSSVKQEYHPDPFLNGPAKEGEGTSQDDIDRLIADTGRDEVDQPALHASATPTGEPK